MKRIATMALASATMIAPLAVPEFANAQQYGGDNGGQWNRDGNYNDGDRNDRDGRANRDRGDNRGGRDRNGGNRHWNDNGDRGRGDGDNRGNRRWDRNRDNGYSWNGRWNYGPPPSDYYGQSGYEPGYRAWRRGDRLPGYYRDAYAGIDYRAYRLRPPPYGYRYVRDDRGEILLVGIATGVILSAILGGNY